MIEEVDIAVVGGGPAGCAAALTAARLGARVTLIDENDQLGGHLRWTLARQPQFPAPFADLRGVDIAHRLFAELTEAGVDVRIGSVAWGLFADGVVGVVTGDSSSQLRAARHVILATGATDIAYPFPGWDQPGVMQSTAVLRLLHVHRVRPGKRAVVLGYGPLAEAVCADLALCDIDIIARAESVNGVRAGGQGQVEYVTIGGVRHAVDLVALALGRQPDSELARLELCEVGYSALDGVFVPLRDALCRTSQPGIFAIGDCAGICTAPEAWAEGIVAAHAAMDSTGIDAAGETLNAMRSTARTIQLAALRLLGGSTGRNEGLSTLNTTAMTDATLVCRCEEVAAGSIRTAIGAGATSISDVKRRTRAGMGICQGIFCTRTIAHMLHTEAGQALEILVPMTARPPARVIPLSALIDMDAG